MEIRERPAEHAAGPGVLKQFIERPAGETDRGGGDRSAEDVERLHRDFEAAAGRPEAAGQGDAAILEAQSRERVRRDHVDAVADGETGIVGKDDKAETPRAPGPSPVRANSV